MLMPRHGSKPGPYAFSVTLIRSGKHWLVDTFAARAPASRADERERPAKVTAVTDFAPFRTAGRGQRSPDPRQQQLCRSCTFAVLVRVR